MDYIPIFLAFFSASIALAGNTWDESEEGIKKLTNRGRVAFIIFIIILFYSFSTVYSVRDKNEQSKEDSIRLSKIIDFEINKSLSSILSPFKQLYYEYNGEGYIPGKPVSIDELLKPQNLNKAQDMCLELRPTSFISFPDSGTWHDIFELGIYNGISRMERLLDRYSHQMDSTLLQKAHDLVENGNFSGYAHYRGYSKDEEVDEKYKCFAGQIVDTHKQYLNMIKEIYKANKDNVYKR